MRLCKGQTHNFETDIFFVEIPFFSCIRSSIWFFLFFFFFFILIDAEQQHQYTCGRGSIQIIISKWRRIVIDLRWKIKIYISNTNWNYDWRTKTICSSHSPTKNATFTFLYLTISIHISIYCLDVECVHNNVYAHVLHFRRIASHRIYIFHNKLLVLVWTGASLLLHIKFYYVLYSTVCSVSLYVCV